MVQTDSYSSIGSNTHQVSLVIPKPPAGVIREMTLAYYETFAPSYNEVDSATAKRKLYTGAIDSYIAAQLKEDREVNRILSIANGTGRRALHIRDLSGRMFEIEGLDPCSTMNEVSGDVGIPSYAGHAEEILEMMPAEVRYDSILFLYSFGHIPTHEWRSLALQGINKVLRPGGTFYLDAFNLEDVTEWGPDVALLYRTKQLGSRGYDLGDVFYKRIGSYEQAFCHYFTFEELSSLVTSCGFQVEESHFVGYAENPGFFDTSPTHGKIFMKLRKPL